MRFHKGIIFAVIVVLCFSGFIYCMMKTDSDNKEYDECDNIYEAGDCLLYQCKMNYSSSIQRGNIMYELYHICIINDDVNVGVSE